jgi:hypothetical protein
MYSTKMCNTFLEISSFYEIKKLNDEFSGKTTEFELLSKTNIEDLWRSDLKVLELSLEKKYKSV